MSLDYIKNVAEQYLTELRLNVESVYYAKALGILIKNRLRLEKNTINSTIDLEKGIYSYLLTEINILISKYRNLQYNLIKGKSSFDVVDALGACIVLDDTKQIKNILYHSSIYSNVSRQISFQTLLDDLLVCQNKIIGIPNLKKNSQSGIFEISLIEKEVIEKDLHDTHFKGHAYIPRYTLKHGTILNYYEVGKRLLRFLKYYDWSISKNDLVDFYIAITQISKEKTTPLDIDLTREKINNVFSSNVDANRKFCVLIDLSRNHIKSIVDLRNSLSEYFSKKAELSSSTLRKYLSEDVFISENAKLFAEEVKVVCKL